MRMRWMVPALLCVLAGGARADFSYEQESEVTGGFLKSAMKFAGAFSKKANQPIRSRIVLKGSRLADIQEEQITITDLDAETLTTIHPKKKEYSVVTFEQMRQFLEKMTAKAGAKKKESGAQDVQMEVDLKVEKTGESKEVEGRSAEAFNVRMKFRGQNPQTGEAGEMQMLMKSWMAEPAAGYDEMRDYYKRYAEKMRWAPTAAMSMMARMVAGSEESLAKAAAEMAKMEGMPVLQQTAMGAGEVQLQEPGQGGAAEPQVDLGKEIKRGLGGLGGFGGFGRRKKQEAEEPAAEQQPASASPGAGVLLQMEIRHRNFSNAPVDAALVDTEPAGFKRVKSEIEKQLD